VVVSNAIYENVTKTVIEALEKGVVPWRKPWHQIGSVPVNATNNRPYRGVNTFLLSIHPFLDHRWLTLKQANEMGGAIKPGEKATTVVFWKWNKPETNESSEESSNVREAPLLRYFRVFNAEQCVGLSLPELYRPEPYPEHERIERAELLVKSMPDAPSIEEGGTTAWYRPSDDHVQIPRMRDFESADAFYVTLYHELGHATGHMNRLNRSGVTGQIMFGSGEYSKEELVAELTSAYCTATVSLDGSLVENTASYIEGWLKVLRGDPKAVIIAAAQAQKAADYIRGIEYSNS